MDARISNYVGRVGERGVRVDRHTPWGNPFIVGRDRSRSVAIAQFAIYLHTHIESMWPDLFKLRGQKLLCHCQPERCHAEILAMVANGVHDSKYLEHRATHFFMRQAEAGLALRHEATGTAPYRPKWLRSTEDATWTRD